MNGATKRDALVADLYETVLFPERVPEALARLNNHLDCDGVHLIGWDEERGGVLVSMLIGQQIAPAENTYLAHYQDVDPRRKMGLESPTGLCIACHDLLDDKFVSRSEFYQDFLIPHGPRYVIGGNIFREGGRNVHVAFNHLVGRPKFVGKKRQAIAGTMYHLSRWMSQMVAAGQLRAAAAAGQHGLDSLEQGVVIYDHQLKIMFVNQTARAWLGDRLLRGNLGLTDGAAGSTFDDRLAHVHRQRSASTVEIRREDGALKLTLLPVPRDVIGSHGLPTALQGLGSVSEHGQSIKHSALSAFYMPSVVVLIQRRSNTVRERSRLIETYGFTEAEARLAVALADGTEVAEYAERQNVKVSTVRTQIRALLLKTGASNLRALVARLAKELGSDK